MHTEILSKEQKEILPYLAQFKKSYYLVGDTAIALHIGHRESIDFDLFTLSKINRIRIKDALWKIPFKKETIFEDFDQLHFLINNVKITFFQYPYPIEHKIKIDNIITMPNLLSLSTMKAFALGRRAKWKDYVDLFYILKMFYSLKEISQEAEKLFDTQFAEKLFIQQLAFHKDIDYSEKVNFCNNFDVEADLIKEFLIETSLKAM